MRSAGPDEELVAAAGGGLSIRSAAPGGELGVVDVPGEPDSDTAEELTRRRFLGGDVVDLVEPGVLVGGVEAGVDGTSVEDVAWSSGI
eukprot:s6656_g1.t1